MSELSTRSLDTVPNVRRITSAQRLRRILDAHPFGTAVAGCVFFLLCVLLPHPFSPTGFDDDWSYSFVALNLAQTGHFHYSGWGSPMILFQSVWAAAWIRLLGFSFDLLRAVSLPFSVGFVAMVYALGRKSGLTPSWAIFGALTVGVSPLFLPLAASFMTEPYSCFCTIVCIYAAVSILDTEQSESATRWLYVLTLSGILGGSTRQTVWAAPFALIPYVAYRRRFERRFLLHSGVSYTVCIAVLLFVLARFTQPYAPLQLSRHELGRIGLQRVVLSCVALGSLTATTLLLALPALLSSSPLWRQLSRKRVLILVAIGAVVAVSLLLLMGDGGLVPFTGNVFSPYGVLGIGQEALGIRPKLLQHRFTVVATAFLLFSGLAFFYVRKGRANALAGPVRAVFLISLVSYIPFLLPGALVGFVFDRYTLPIVPLLVIYLLAQMQPLVGSIPVATAWACLLIFAVYGIVATHDYYSSLRARDEATRELIARGVPAPRISGGFEQDGWTQLQASGHLQAVTFGHSAPWNTKTVFWFWSYATALHPAYVVRNLPGWEPTDRALPAIRYRAWAPPFKRSAVISKRSDLPLLTTCDVFAACLAMDRPETQSITKH